MGVVKMDNDIHGYDRRLEKLTRNIDALEIDEDSKTLLHGYERDLLLYEALSKPRRERLISSFLWLIKNTFKKPIKEIKLEDVKGAVEDIEKADYSPWTKSLYKISIRKIFRWRAYGPNKLKEYPPLVSWIKVHVKKKDQPRVQTSAILTEGEVHKLIEAADTSRSRAFLSMLYELGARISEIGNLKIKDLTRDEYSYIVDLVGKTGHRTPRIVLLSNA